MITEKEEVVDERSVEQLGTNSSLTERRIAEEARVTINVRNVRRILKNCEHLKRQTLQRES